jgi:hypothetical protein
LLKSPIRNGALPLDLNPLLELAQERFIVPNLLVTSEFFYRNPKPVTSRTLGEPLL